MLADSQTKGLPDLPNNQVPCVLPVRNPLKHSATFPKLEPRDGPNQPAPSSSGDLEAV